MEHAQLDPVLLLVMMLVPPCNRGLARSPKVAVMEDGL